MLASERRPSGQLRDRAWRSSAFESARRFPEQLAGWLDHNSRIVLLAFSILYLLGNGLTASHKFLWADEVLTAYMARLSLPQLWSALKAGVDIEPPLFHLITRAFTSAFGQSPLALRMPAILGGWLMCISLYIFVSRRLRPLYGLIAMLIPFVTRAADYTYEARCYGIALGFSGAALVCWQGAAERRRRKLCLIGLVFFLAAAIACQFYMVLVLLSIGAGEILRSVLRADIDRSIWMALAAAIIPLPFHLPLIRAAMTFTGGSWSAATPSSLVSAYELFLARGVLPVAAIVLGLAIWELFGSGIAKPTRNARVDAIPPWEILTGIALACSLVGAFLLAKLTNGIFALRYGTCVVFGSALLPLPIIRRYDTRSSLAGALSLVVLAGSFIAHDVIRPPNRFETPSLLRSADDPLPIVIENPLDFMELIYNAPPQLAGRLCYLTSREDSIRYTGTDDDERGLLLLSRYYPIRVYGPKEFLKQHKRIMIWRGDKDLRWLLRKLADDGEAITVARISDGESLFVATSKLGAR